MQRGKKITGVDGLCLLTHPALRFKSATIKCIPTGVPVLASLWHHSLQTLEETTHFAQSLYFVLFVWDSAARNARW